MRLRAYFLHSLPAHGQRSKAVARMSPRDRIGGAISAIVAPESGTMPRVSAKELNHQLLRAGLKTVGKKLSGAFDDDEVDGVKTMEGMCQQLQEHMSARSISQLTLRLSSAVGEWWDSPDTSECITQLVENLVEKSVDKFVLEATEIVVALWRSKFVEEADEGEDGEEDDISSESSDSDEEDLSSDGGEEDCEDGGEDDDEDDEEDVEEDGEDSEEAAEKEDDALEVDNDLSAKRSYDDADEDEATGLVLSKRARK